MGIPTAISLAPYDQQIGNSRGEHDRLVLGLVEIGDEVDRFAAFDNRQQLLADARQARLGITHGRRRIAVDRAEIARPSTRAGSAC